MNRSTSPQLMTIEEAQALSNPRASRDVEERRRHVWAWQSVAGAMNQEVSDEAIERMAALNPATRSYRS